MKLNFILILSVFVIASCAKNTSPPAPPVTPPKINSGVFVGGTEKASNGGIVLKYWKDGVPVILSDSSNTRAFCGGIVVTDTNIYVSGSELNLTGYDAVVWNNGSIIYNWPGYTCNNLVLSGNDLYISGNTGDSKMANYWKNAGLINLPSDTTGDYINASQIFVLNGDVYSSGTETFSNNATAVKYWKNGIAHVISDAIYAFADGIYVYGTDIYLFGSDIPNAVYWKNGAKTNLTTNNYDGVVFGMYVSGNDVYACGLDSTFAVYWKNGVESKLTNGIEDARATGMVMSGNDLYISGQDGDTAKYWKNGVSHTLTNGNNLAKASAIFVK